MKDLISPFWIKFKGILFLLVGLCAGTLLWLENPTWKTALFLALTVWCFCRFYYFAFYVIEKYVDGKYRFAGLWDFCCYMVRGKTKDS